MQDQYKYHLKDKKKEQLLSQLCKDSNTFLEALQPIAEKLYNHEYDILEVKFGDLPVCKEYSIALRREEIIKINEYNPKIWNNFLKVVPPEYVPLRLEVLREIKRDYCSEVSRQCYCAIWDGRHFFVANVNGPAIQIDQDELISKELEVYFKAWDD